MKIGRFEWHEGIGYDLDALAALPPEDRLTAEDLVVARHAADWRDLEALDHIGSERALRELEKAVHAKSVEIRIEAAERLVKRKLLGESDVEALIVDALARATFVDGLVKTLRFAAAYPTPAVRSKLLSCALDGNNDIRVHAAALVHFLHGHSSSPFDAAFRSFYLRFASKNMVERRSAYLELCARIGVEPSRP